MVLLYLKLVAEYSLYASIINGNIELFFNSINFLPVILVMALAPCVSKFLYDKFGGNIRILGVIPIIVAFFFSEFNFANVVLLIPIAFYSLTMVVRRNVDVEYYTFKKQFTIWAILGAVIFFFCYGLHMYMGYDAKEMKAGLLYYLAFFVIGIVVARRLRYCNEKTSVDSIKSIAAVGVIAFIGTGLYKLADVFGNEINGAIRDVLAVLFIPLGWMYEKFADFMRDSGGMVRVASGNAEEQASVYEGEFGNGHYGGETEGVKFDLPIENIIIVATIILLMTAFIIAAVTFYSKTRNLKKNEYLHEKIEDIQVKKKAPFFSNEEKIRRIYRQFLSFTSSMGVKISPNMTSEEIIDALNARVNKAEAEALRNIYIGVRYDDFSKPTDEDVRIAKEAMKKINS